MTSIDSPLAEFRLPPRANTLEPSLDLAVRARRRRVLTADHPGFTLRALAVADDAIDRVVVASAMEAPRAIAWLQSRIDQSNGDELDALVFVLCAVAVQSADGSASQFFERYASRHARAICDAYRFFPVPATPFSDSDEHIRELFSRPQASEDLNRLMIDLAGMRAVRSLKGKVEAFLDNPAFARNAHLALARMDCADTATQLFVQHGLQSASAVDRDVALQVAAANPRLANPNALAELVENHPNQAEAAWAILSVLAPRRTFDFAMTNDELETSIKLRIAAQTGFIDAIISLCAELAERPDSITPAEADVLLLVLGEVPAEVRADGVAQETKSRVLRELLLRACRHAHITVQNDADLAPWRLEEIVTDAEQARQIQVRHAARFSDDAPRIGPEILDVTHGLRQALYLETATRSGITLPLLTDDISRRQQFALSLAELDCELRAQ